MVRRVTQATLAIIFFAATLYTSAVSAHGRVAMEDDICMRQIGENIIHLSIYQPEFDVEGHYCTEIPQVGETLLVVDLVDPSLREMPIGLKVFKGNNETDGELIANLSPKYYADGVISTYSVLDEKGVYSITITAEGVPPLSYRYQLRVEMINYSNVFRAAIGPVVGLLLISLIAYKVVQSRRRKKRAKEEAAAEEAAAKLAAAKKLAEETEAAKLEAARVKAAEDAAETNLETAQQETIKQVDSDAK